MEMGGYFYRFSLKRNDPQIPATLSTPCDIIGQKAAFFEFFSLAPKLAMSKKSSKIKGLRERKKYFCEYLTHSDDLGRVVVPKEIRRTLRLRDGEPMEIFTGREGEIILKKYSPIGELGNFAKDIAQVMAQVTGHLVCVSDHDAIIAASGPDQKDYLGKIISVQLEEAIRERSVICASAQDKSFIPVSAEEGKAGVFQVIQPILSAGDAIGAVIFISRKEKVSLAEAEIKLAAVAAGFLGKQMEQ